MGPTPPLTFNPHELDVLGETHERIGGEVRTACAPDPGVLGASGAYGAAGAYFTTVLSAYLTRLKATGEQLGQRYSDQGAAIRAAGQQLTAVDAQNAAQFPPPPNSATQSDAAETRPKPTQFRVGASRCKDMSPDALTTR